MRFTVDIELERLGGPEQDADTMLDCFAGTIGRQNAAPRPLKLYVDSGESVSIYRVKLVDDALVNAITQPRR